MRRARSNRSLRCPPASGLFVDPTSPHLGPSLAVAVLCCVLLGACDVYDRGVLGQLDGGAATDAAGLDAGEAVDGGDGGFVAACEHAVVPNRPGTDDEIGDPIVFVLKDVLLDPEDDRVWDRIGRDIDGFCTGEDTKDAECLPPNETRAPVDSEGGRDNLFGGSLMPVVVRQAPDVLESIERAYGKGRLAILLYLEDYDGTANDPRVDAYLAPTVRAERDDDGAAPAWDGEDRFYVSEDAFVDADADRPVVRDDAAYVRDRQLVVRLPEGSPVHLPWFGSGLGIPLSRGVLTGTLSEDLSSIANAEFSGSLSKLDLDRMMEDAGLCEEEYESERGLLDEWFNLNADLRVGSVAPGVECNALSVGLRFTGYRGHFAGLEPLVLPPLCP